MRRRGLGMFLVFVGLAGCAAPKTAEQRARDDEFNRTWREGIGFNNPNAARAKKGLKPLNYDGSDPDSEWITDMGNAVGGFLWDVTRDAFKRCLLRCLDGDPRKKPTPDATPNPTPPAAEVSGS